MKTKELEKLEYTILDVLSLHGSEIDPNKKDSKQIYDFPELRLYTKEEITFASKDMLSKKWIVCFIDDTDKNEPEEAYWHELLDDGRTALRKYSMKKNKADSKSTANPNLFFCLVQGKDQKEKKEIIKRLHNKLDGIKGKNAAMYLLKAKEDKLISKIPTQKEFESEFTESGKWHSISTYLNPNKIVDISSVII